MDLMTLDANNQPAKLVENYDSLIWTERFNTVGDFQLVGGDVSRFMTLLPEGTRLTLRESNIAMVVETHQIERKKNSPEKVTIKGRAFESILDRRVSLPSLAAATGSSDWNVSAKTPSDVAWYIVNQICVTGSLSALDIFPTAMVQFPTPSDYGTSTGPTKTFQVSRGNLLNVVLDLLQTEAKADATTTPATPAVVQHGIRAVRPNSAGTAIAVQLYTGTDKSATVYFDATRELLDDGTYLFSKVGSANVGYGLGSNFVATMFEGVTEASGLARRVALIDASEADITTTDPLKVYMAQTLAEASETAIFDGNVNPDLNPYKYGIDYMLGDIVKMVGDYGLNELARVTEYIRSEDSTGQKSYPTLTTIVA